MTSIAASLCHRPISKSALSCAGVTFKTPVPIQNTCSSPMMGMTSVSRGIRERAHDMLPRDARKRVKFRFTGHGGVTNVSGASSHRQKSPEFLNFHFEIIEKTFSFINHFFVGQRRERRGTSSPCVAAIERPFL